MFNIKKLFGKKEVHKMDTEPKLPVLKPTKTQIVFQGESEKELIKKMKNCGQINKRNKNERLAEPLGTIVVGFTHKDSWIANKKSFMGWNVMLCSINTKMIRSRYAN